MLRVIADALTATAHHKQIALRWRVDEPRVRFAQSQPPRASCSGRHAAHATLPPDTVKGRWSSILNFELLMRLRREKSIRSGCEDGSDCDGAAPILTATARGGADSRAARSKSAKTKLRHAHRLFSSDHQPSSASLRCPPACPHPQLNPSSGSMDNARVDWSSNPPTWPLRSARRFQAIKINKTAS